MAEERFFSDNEIVVSKTDAKGVITYANQVFIGISGFSEDELLGVPHSIIRHEDMPRCVFKLLWDTIQEGQEIFAYVKNRAKNGDYYWVYAHVTPTFDRDRVITHYHSSRRVPERKAIEAITPIYRALLDKEREYGNRKEGMLAAHAMLMQTLKDKGVNYERFILSL